MPLGSYHGQSPYSKGEKSQLFHGLLPLLQSPPGHTDIANIGDFYVDFIVHGAPSLVTFRPLSPWHTESF